MTKKELQGFKQLKHISNIIYLEEANPVALILKGLIAVGILLFVLIVWSCFVTISETTNTFGQLVPEGQIQVIQHLEGGIANKVMVEDGDRVKKNQILLQLSTEELYSELNELRSNEISLSLDSMRLRAYLDHKQIDPDVWSEKIIHSKYNLVKSKAEIENLIKAQSGLLDEQYTQLREMLEGETNTLRQHREELDELKNKKKIWETHIKLLNEEFEMYQKLKQKAYISSRDYLNIMREMNQARGDGASLDSKIEQMKESIGEAENKLQEISATNRKDALTDLSKAESSLMALHHKIEKIEEQIARSTIRSPIAGTVKGIAIYKGNVVKAASVLMEIVPEGEKLIAESHIQPQDIGNIKIGAPVKVKILTYDYARYGIIDSEVTQLSASTFFDEKGNPYYKAKMRLSSQYLGGKGQEKKLKSGMTIQADIITGSKTLFAYLLKPIQRSVTDSFREQ